MDDEIRLMDEPEEFNTINDGYDRLDRPFPVVVEESPRRVLPWFLDIFLFPSNVAGLTTIAIVAGAVFLLSLFNCFLVQVGLPLLVMGFGLATMIIRLVLAAYYITYFEMSIQESASGEVRAPDSIAMDIGDTSLEMLWKCVRLYVVIFIFAGWGGIYYWNTGRFDTVFWAIEGVGVFLLPMGLLAVIMYDSLGAGLNPFRLVWSILKTLIPYSGVVVLFYGVCFLIFLAGRMIAQGQALLSWITPIVVALGVAVTMYLFLVAGHVLGMFFCRYEEILGWEV